MNLNVHHKEAKKEEIMKYNRDIDDAIKQQIDGYRKHETKDIYDEVDHSNGRTANA